MSKHILVTGAAGFIGYHLSKALLKKGYSVTGIDNINEYYDVNLKYARLKDLGITSDNLNIFKAPVISSIFGERMKFIRLNIEDRIELPKIFEKGKFDLVCNLAAQAGVRYSIENPSTYIDSNISGFSNILECCRQYNIKRLVYASSSSVYGNSNKVPFNESDDVDQPISLYAATKKSNELMAHTYSHLFELETIGLRFFTVYGPWGRPDMAYFLFADAIMNKQPINVFNNGNLSRDFTYIDDIIEGVLKTLLKTSKNKALYKLYNIGNNTPIMLKEFIEAIESSMGARAIKKNLPMQPGDVFQTFADIDRLKTDFDYHPKTKLKKGINEFINWYKSWTKE